MAVNEVTHFCFHWMVMVPSSQTTWSSSLLSSVSAMVLICSFPRIYRCPPSCVMIERCHWLTASDLPQHHLQSGLPLGNSSFLYFLFRDVLNTMQAFLGFYSSLYGCFSYGSQCGPDLWNWEILRRPIEDCYHLYWIYALEAVVRQNFRVIWNTLAWLFDSI